MASFEMDDRKKIGLGLTGFGIFFTILGIIFLFDKGLLAMGNILFLSDVALTIGLKSTLGFFMKPQNYKGTVSFGLGFFLVIIPCHYWLANRGHAVGIIWIYCTFQWLLAYSGRFCAEDTRSWLAVATSTG